MLSLQPTMPIYEYACEKCGKLVEQIQKVTDAGPKKCEHCGGGMSRVMSRSSFQLKGGGWYKDLYSSAPAKKDGASESKGGSDSKGSSSEKASDKPTATSDKADKSAKPEGKGSSDTGSSSKESKSPAASASGSKESKPAPKASSGSKK
jgi:putative FmdB family regulatory protein